MRYLLTFAGTMKMNRNQLHTAAVNLERLLDEMELDYDSMYTWERDEDSTIWKKINSYLIQVPNYDMMLESIVDELQKAGESPITYYLENNRIYKVRDNGERYDVDWIIDNVDIDTAVANASYMYNLDRDMRMIIRG